MANFQPMKRRLLLVLEENMRLFSIGGRFLDYGSGSGDVSEHLALQTGIRGGVAYDPGVPPSEIEARQREAAAGLVYSDRLDEESVDFEFAVLFDVIEHVPDAPGVLKELHRRVRDDGWLFVTVPYNRQEWGIDDDYYGHLRRLSRRGVICLLENHGWDVVRTLDPTFPTFWLMRRVYLLLTRVSPKLRARHATDGAALDRSLASSTQSSWETMGPIPRLLSSVLIPWKLVRFFDLYFESVFLGFELFVVCQRRSTSRVCEVCDNGLYTHDRFFGRTSRQVCGYCGSELMLPRSAESPSPPLKRISGLVSAVRRWLSPFRAARIRKLVPPEASMIDIRSRDVATLLHLRESGWTVVGTVPEGEAPSGALEDGETVLGDPPGVELGRRFGVVELRDVIDCLPDLKASLVCLDRLLLPGGYLILQYPNSRSLLKRVVGSRWFGYDPPHHRLQINPVFLADRLGLEAYRLLRESHFSIEYSFFTFAQSLANALLPFQRDSIYRLLTRPSTSLREKIGGLFSLPVFAIAAPLFPVHQLLASLLGRGCIVQQVFQKADLGETEGSWVPHTRMPRP